MDDDLLPSERLLPYVSALATGWRADSLLPDWATVDGTLAFADISGFTRLTESLSARGKAGAEELARLLDAVFADLLADAFAQGAELVKWGGDAVLLLFTGTAHAVRAAVAARRLQRRIAASGRLRTSVGTSRLRMSIGMHSGTFHLFLVGRAHRELVLCGPAATETARLEGAAEAGEILVSPATAALLPHGVLGATAPRGVLIAGTPRPVAVPARAPGAATDPSAFLDPALAGHLAAGPVDAEHRQVAVAFLEFSGVDALLAEAGPEVLAAALHDVIVRVQESCRQHGVVVWETDIGEGGGKIMLVAGAPTGSEDDVGRMLHVVRAVLDAGGRLGLRAGVNAGRVFAGDFGPATRRTYSVKGDAVNLAARLMARAEPGEAYVAEAALAGCRTAVDAEPIAPFPVKGKAALVHAVRLRGVDAAPQHALADLAPLAGRDAELNRLAELLASARGGHGRSVRLVGEPGIGKSRLIAELQADAADCVVLSTRCDAYRSATPYATARELARQALGVDGAASPAVVAATLIERCGRDAPDLLPFAPLLAAVLGTEVPATAEVEGLDERFRRARLESVTVDLLRVLLPTPTLVVVDDAHLLDEASASLLERVVAAAADEPWLVLLAARPEGAAPPGGAEVLDLAPLPDEVVGALVQTVTEAAPLPPHRRAAMVARCAGNPLFALELATSGTGPSHDALPDTVEQLFVTRIDRLAPVDRRLLRAASVLGLRVPLDVLRAMVQEPVDPERLAALGDHLVPDGPDALRFRHALVRDTAYEGLPFAHRRRLHAAAGEAILRLAGSDDVAPLLAVHFAAAGDDRSTWRWARTAADRAAAVYAHVQAAELAERALSAGRAVPDVPASELVAVAEALGDARTHLGEFGRAETAFRLAAGWADAPLTRATLQYRVALAADRQGDYRRCLQRLTTAERLLPADDVPAAGRLRAQIRAQYGLVRHRQGRGTDAVRLLREAVRLADDTGEADLLAPALLYLDIAELTLGIPGNGEHADRALAVLQGAGDQPWLEARALNQLGIRSYYAGRWAEAVTRYAASRDACRRAGDEWTAAVASANIAEVLSDQGHLEQARAALETALHTYRAAGTRIFVADGTRLLGRIAARQGDAARAFRLLTEARAIYHADGETLQTAYTDALLAEAAVLDGQYERGRALAQAALEVVAALPGRGLATPLLHRVLGSAAAGLGDTEAATAHLTASIADARARSAAYDLVLSLRALCGLSPTPLPEAAAEAAALAAGLGIIEDRAGAAA